jgi:hypothetical protein
VSGVYTITGPSSGCSLDLSDASDAEDTPIIGYRLNRHINRYGSTNQQVEIRFAYADEDRSNELQWKIEFLVGTGFCTIQSVYPDSYCRVKGDRLQEVIANLIFPKCRSDRGCNRDARSLAVKYELYSLSNPLKMDYSCAYLNCCRRPQIQVTNPASVYLIVTCISPWIWTMQVFVYGIALSVGLCRAHSIRLGVPFFEERRGRAKMGI